MPKLPIPTIRPWQQHACNRSTTAQVATPVLASTAATSASGTTIVVSSATWTTNQYQNDWVMILTGTGSGQTRNITSNTATTLTVPTWTVTPDNTSTFQIVQPIYPGLQGSLMSPSTGGTVLVGVTYRECIPIAGATQVTVRLKTTTAVGTLTLTPVRLLAVNPDDPAIYQPDGSVDTTKVQKYGTGGSSSTAVVAGTELALSINPAGEAYCLVEFAVTTAGTLNYCDAMTLQSGGSSTGGGVGESVTVTNFPTTQPVSVANGSDTALGSTTDAAQIDYTQTATLIALTKGISEVLQGTGAGAVVPVKQQDASGNVQPAGDVAGRALFVQAQGEIADGSSSTGVSSVLVGGNDASGLARTAANILLSSTPTSTSSYGFSTYSQVAAVGSANTIHPIGSGQNLGDAGNGSNYLAVVEGRWNEVTFDRQRGNTQIQLLSSAAHTTATSADQINYNGRALHLIVNITTGAGSMTLAINGKEIGGTTYYPLIPTSSALSGVTQTVFKIGIGLTAGTNVVNDFLPRTFQVIYTVTGSLTFSIGYNILS